MELNEILTVAVKARGSDIHIKSGLPPVVRIDGTLRPIPNASRMSPEQMQRIAFGIMNEKQKTTFQDKLEMDLSYGVPGLGRFRVSVYMQRGTIGMVFRSIPYNIPSLDSLNLPSALKKIALEERGLVLVTGTTGSGKSTTLAAMIDHVNRSASRHVITVEDPIEYLHRDKKSIINQREVGSDTNDFSKALRSALRQDPDVILVGEMRDLETIETALLAAETGHLVLSTLHTLDAPETINRIISMFPPHHQKQIRIQLASVLKAIISMRLLPRSDDKGRVPAVEILISTPFIQDCIVVQEKTKLIKEAIAQGISQYGMQTFDQSLYFLYQKNFISFDEALKWASNPDEFKLKKIGVQSAKDMSMEEMEKRMSEIGGSAPEKLPEDLNQDHNLLEID